MRSFSSYAGQRIRFESRVEALRLWPGPRGKQRPHAPGFPVRVEDGGGLAAVDTLRSPRGRATWWAGRMRATAEQANGGPMACPAYVAAGGSGIIPSGRGAQTDLSAWQRPGTRRRAAPTTSSDRPYIPASDERP